MAAVDRRSCAQTLEVDGKDEKKMWRNENVSQSQSNRRIIVHLLAANKHTDADTHARYAYEHDIPWQIITIAACRSIKD